MRVKFWWMFKQTLHKSIIANGNNDIDYIFSSFYSKYNKIINKHVPIKQISRRQLKRFSKPWTEHKG